MNKALSYLSIARKAGRAELGEEPVAAVTREGKSALVLVASDASDHTWRRAQSFIAHSAQPCIRLHATKAEMGAAVGRGELAIAAITDAPLALALAMADDPPNPAAIAALESKAARSRQRAREAKAHERNKRAGKKK